MKKILLMTLAVAMGAAFAEEAKTVTLVSQNTVGILSVKRGVGSEMTVPVPFVKVGDGGVMSLSDALYVENNALATTYGVCLDSPYGYFDIWTRFPTDDFYPTPREQADGVEVIPSPASEQKVPRGAGVMLQTTTSMIHVMGQYDAQRPQTTIPTGKRSYLANPTTEGFLFDEKLTAAIGVVEGDIIYVSNGSLQREYRYSATGSGGKHWYYQRVNQVAQTVLGKTRIVDKITKVYNEGNVPEIPAGGSFYYMRYGSSDLTFTW